MCRLEEWPEPVKTSINDTAKPVFAHMFGPYSFNCTGNIRDYNRVSELQEINIPVLLIHGEHDYIVPEIACIARDNLPNVKLTILRGCSHMPFYERPDAYAEMVLEFLALQA